MPTSVTTMLNIFTITLQPRGKNIFRMVDILLLNHPLSFSFFFKSIFEFVGKKHKTISHKESQAERRMKGKIDHEIRVLSYQWIFGR